MSRNIAIFQVQIQLISYTEQFRNLQFQRTTTYVHLLKIEKNVQTQT